MADDDKRMTDDDRARWQTAHDSAQALSKKLNDEYDDAQTQDQRDALDALADGASEALTALNQQDMQSRTADIQAAEEPLKGSIDKLGKLKDQLESVSAGFAKAAGIISGVDKAITDLKAFIAV